jgi:hypothetical protein
MEITKKKAQSLGKYFKIDYSKTPFMEFYNGLLIESEHADILKGNYHTLTRIVMAHLDEHPRYYYYLKKAGL